MEYEFIYFKSSLHSERFKAAEFRNLNKSWNNDWRSDFTKVLLRTNYSTNFNEFYFEKKTLAILNLPFTRVWFAGDIWRCINSFRLIDWLIDWLMYCANGLMGSSESRPHSVAHKSIAHCLVTKSNFTLCLEKITHFASFSIVYSYRPTCTTTSLGDRAFAVAGPRAWNSLPHAIRDPSLSPSIFGKLLKTYLFV